MCFFTSSTPTGEMIVHPHAHVAMFPMREQRGNAVYKHGAESQESLYYARNSGTGVDSLTG